MSDPLEILLTNDDGIDSPGIRALYDRLSAVGSVTVVAPATDQSATGRALSYEVDVREHELGYAVEGTPSDCVVAGLAELGPYPDVVVSGCNRGANLGMYVLGRSGTVGAAVEAAFFGVPSVASSLYFPPDEFGREASVAEFDLAADATAHLVEGALDCGVFEEADYLNLNAPLAPADPVRMEITRPSHVYDMDATNDGGRVTLHDNVWDEMAAGSIPDPEGTDRRAVLEGNVSVSPLTAPHTTERHDALDDVAANWG